MLDFLQNSDLVSIILSDEVIFCAIFTLSVFIAVHSLLGLMRQSNALYTRLARIEADLNVLQASIPGKLERIRNLRETQAPLKERFTQIQAYYSRCSTSTAGGTMSRSRRNERKKRTRTIRSSGNAWVWIASSDRESASQKKSPDPRSATISPASCSTKPSLNTRLSR